MFSESFISAAASSIVLYLGILRRMLVDMVLRVGVNDLALSEIRYGIRRYKGDPDCRDSEAGVEGRRGDCGAERDMVAKISLLYVYNVGPFARQPENSDALHRNKGIQQSLNCKGCSLANTVATEPSA